MGYVEAIVVAGSMVAGAVVYIVGFWRGMRRGYGRGLSDSLEHMREQLLEDEGEGNDHL